MAETIEMTFRRAAMKPHRSTVRFNTGGVPRPPTTSASIGAPSTSTFRSVTKSPKTATP